MTAACFMAWSKCMLGEGKLRRLTIRAPAMEGSWQQL